VGSWPLGDHFLREKKGEKSLVGSRPLGDHFFERKKGENFIGGFKASRRPSLGGKGKGHPLVGYVE